MAICPSCRVDDGGLSYQKRSRNSRTLGVIVHTQLGVNMILGRPAAGERRKDDAMRKGQATHLERVEKNRWRHLSLRYQGEGTNEVFAH